MDETNFKSTTMKILINALIVCKHSKDKLRGLQYFYKKSPLQYFLDLNKISNFTQEMLPKSRAAPTTHTKIWGNTLDRRN